MIFTELCVLRLLGSAEGVQRVPEPVPRQLSLELHVGLFAAYGARVRLERHHDRPRTGAHRGQ